jgi:RND family efflux transporter MFP subunit
MAGSLSEELASLRIRRDDPPPSPRWGRYVAVVVTLAAVGAAAVFGKSAIEARVFKTEVELTEIASISAGQASIDVTSTGYVVPQVVAKVGAKVVGRITRVGLAEGDTVRAGQTLFELDPADQKSAIASAQARAASARARVETARASLAEGKLQHEREKRLVASGATATATAEDLAARVTSLEAQVHAAEAEVAAAQAETSSLSTNLKNLTIASPIDGVAMSKPAQLGEVTTSEIPLVELYDPKSLLVETDVPEGRLHLIKQGGPCEVVLDSLPNDRFRGTVVEISPRINRAKATATVKVKFVDQPNRLDPEMSARVSFLSKPLDENALKTPPRIVVPASAITDRSGAKVVFVYDGDHVRMTNVVLGEPTEGGFEVRDGPAPGTRIVKAPPASLADGQSVKEKNPS